MFKRTLAKIKAERSGIKPPKKEKKKKKKPKKIKPIKPKEPVKKPEIKPTETTKEIKPVIEPTMSTTKEIKSLRETEPPLAEKSEREEDIFKNKEIKIEEIKEANHLIKKEVIKMTEKKEEIPVMKFESDAAVPILSYKVPSPSSYEGRNYIELETDKSDFNDNAQKTPKPEEEIKDFFETNRENIYEYLKNATKHDLERDLYLVFDIDDIAPQQVKVQYPATINFDNEDWNQEWNLSNPDTSSLEMIPEFQGHKNILKFYNQQGGLAKYRLAQYVFDQPKKSGTIEFWFAVSGLGNSYYIFLGDDKNSREPNTGMCIVDIAMSESQIKYYDRVKGWINIANLSANKWYHMRIDFDYENENVVVYLDQNLILRSGHFHNPVGRNGVENISFCVFRNIVNQIFFIDAIGFSWDPNYNVGDNLASEAVLDAQSALKSNLLNSLDTIDSKITDMLNNIKIEADDQGNIIDYGLKAKYSLFKYFVQVAFAYNKMPVFYNTMGGKLKLRYVKIPYITPRIMLIETYKLTNYPGDYGPGEFIKTFSLLPGEETEISIKTWKKSMTSMKEASSVLDSYTEEKADEFENNIQKEGSQTSKIDQSSTLNTNSSSKSTWGASASAGYMGISASASAGGEKEKSLGVEANISSSREAFGKNILNTTSKHAQESSAKRDVNIETSYEKTEEEGEEIAILRKIENLNVSRTLNFTFRQMNQEFHSLLHLTNLRLGFFNGYPGTMKEYELYEIDDFIKDYINYQITEESIVNAGTEIGDQISEMVEEIEEPPKVPFNEVKQRLTDILLNEYKEIIDYEGDKQKFIEIVEFENERNNYLRVIPTTKEEGRQPYTIREDPLDLRYVDGVIIGRNKVIMRTDGVIVEALLGHANALDDFSLEARKEKIRMKQYDNELKRVEILKTEMGIKIIEKLIADNNLTDAIAAYNQFFGIEEGLKSIREAIGSHRLELKSIDQ